jgi:hypothetical protein
MIGKNLPKTLAKTCQKSPKNPWQKSARINKTLTQKS